MSLPTIDGIELFPRVESVSVDEMASSNLNSGNIEHEVDLETAVVRLKNLGLSNRQIYDFRVLRSNLDVIDPDFYQQELDALYNSSKMQKVHSEGKPMPEVDNQTAAFAAHLVNAGYDEHQALKMLNKWSTALGVQKPLRKYNLDELLSMVEDKHRREIPVRQIDSGLSIDQYFAERKRINAEDREKAKEVLYSSVSRMAESGKTNQEIALRLSKKYNLLISESLTRKVKAEATRHGIESLIAGISEKHVDESRKADIYYDYMAESRAKAEHELYTLLDEMTSSKMKYDEIKKELESRYDVYVTKSMVSALKRRKTKYMASKKDKKHKEENASDDSEKPAYHEEGNNGSSNLDRFLVPDVSTDFLPEYPVHRLNAETQPKSHPTYHSFDSNRRLNPAREPSRRASSIYDSPGVVVNDISTPVLNRDEAEEQVLYSERDLSRKTNEFSYGSSAANSHGVGYRAMKGLGEMFYPLLVRTGIRSEKPAPEDKELRNIGIAAAAYVAFVTPPFIYGLFNYFAR